MAFTLAPKQYFWILRGLKNLVSNKINTTLWTDNRAAIDVANSPKIIDETKLIDKTYNFTKERVKNGVINLLYVPSANNLAHICTKGLYAPRNSHLYAILFDTKLGGVLVNGN